MNKTVLNVLGWLVLLATWYIITALDLVNKHILPTPGNCLTVLGELLTEPNPDNSLMSNVWFSIKLNLAGYAESILLALPVGFALGQFKTVRIMFSQQIDSLRFVPISALGGLFVALSGLTLWTKIHFLAFGIWVYLVPVIVQRIDEINPVHLQMMKTLGASKLQTFWFVTWKSVTSRLSDDIRILVGIGWTYIIMAEMKNDQGGLGHMIALGDKQASIEIVYIVVTIIIIIGVCQDKLLKGIDWLMYRYKYS